MKGTYERPDAGAKHEEIGPQGVERPRGEGLVGAVPNQRLDAKLRRGRAQRERLARDRDDPRPATRERFHHAAPQAAAAADHERHTPLRLFAIGHFLASIGFGGAPAARASQNLGASERHGKYGQKC